MTSQRTRKPKPTPTTWHGPRIVGGTYLSAYWGKSYTVLAASADDMTVLWADGRTTSHRTAWDRRDQVI